MITLIVKDNNNLRVRAREKSYSCTHCQKSFVRPETQKAHEVFTKGKRKFTCSLSLVFCNISGNIQEFMQGNILESVLCIISKVVH